MPDKKLTDNEIKIALQCCYATIKEECEICPNKNTCGEIDVIASTVDLINRLQAENERLNNEISDREISHINLYNESKAEIERLNALIAQTNEQRGAVIHAITHIDETKAEAYKEFAERLKGISIKKVISYITYCSIQEHEIEWLEIKEEELDNLLKELVGEDNG